MKTHTKTLIFFITSPGKGANEVASMVLYYLNTILKRNSKHLVLWADNCGGQNKNSTLIQTFLDLVRNGLFDIVELKFQIKGHTRNSVDRGFGLTKRAYNRNDVLSFLGQ